MKDKQLTLKEILEKITNAECLSCGSDINKTIHYNWKIPLCKKCRLEVAEDLEEELDTEEETKEETEDRVIHKKW